MPDAVHDWLERYSPTRLSVSAMLVVSSNNQHTTETTPSQSYPSFLENLLVCRNWALPNLGNLVTY